MEIQSLNNFQISKGFKINLMQRVIHTIIILISGTVILSSCRKDEIHPWYDECKAEINSASETHFKMDAIHMTAWRTFTDSTSQYKNSPILDQALYNYILGKLSAIFNEALNPESDLYDMIFKYQIHRMGIIVLDELYMKVPDDEFRNQILDDPLNTSNIEFNDLCEKYGFTKSYYLYGLQTIRLKSDSNYYTPALASILGEISGIHNSHFSVYFNTDGNHIDYKWTDDYDEFTFDYGFGGDCYVGCAYHHFWQVRVDQNCNVTLVEEYGDPIPG